MKSGPIRRFLLCSWATAKQLAKNCPTITGFHWFRLLDRWPWVLTSQKLFTAVWAGQLWNSEATTRLSSRPAPEMATQSIFFGAVGTAGQRCTSTRRVIMHESVASKVRRKLLAAYKSLPIGNPLDGKTVMGPLIDKNAVDLVQHSIQRLKDEGGEILYGGERLTVPGGCYMKPCLATAKPDFEIVKHETFGPLLYLMTYRDFDEAIAIQNNVPQGLTSSIFTNDVREAERFVSAVGSDCGIANVNTGTSGRRRPRERQRLLEELHAPPDEHR